MPTWLLGGALSGAMAALVGGYWDDAWHTERGRDSFFIAPHIAIYAGVTLTGAALAMWVLRAALERGVRGVVTDGPLVLAGIGVAATLASAPVDNAWHIAFGRDAVLWSPPHLLGIVGMFALASALLVQATDSWRRVGVAVAGGVVFAAANFVVIEYDTDVPQFAVTWYLPALTAAAAVAFAVVDLATRSRWAVSAAAAAHIGLVLGVAAFLELLGFVGPALPLLIGSAVVYDVGRRRGWSPTALAGAVTAAVYVVYVPVRNELGSGVALDSTTVLTGAPVAFGSAWLVLRTARPGPSLRPRLRPVGVAAALTALLLGSVRPEAAFAHDPGQGPAAPSVALTVSVSDAVASVRATSPHLATGTLGPRGLAARRAGVTVRAPLERRGGGLSGRIRLPEPGRWFVYVELIRDDEPIEAWLPVKATRRPTSVADPERYAYVASAPASSAIKYLSGAMVYSAATALLAGALVVLRRRREADPPVASAA